MQPVPAASLQVNASNQGQVNPDDQGFHLMVGENAWLALQTQLSDLTTSSKEQEGRLNEVLKKWALDRENWSREKEVSNAERAREREVFEAERAREREVFEAERAREREAFKAERAHEKEASKAERVREKEASNAERAREKEASNAERAREREAFKAERAHEKEAFKAERAHEREDFKAERANLENRMRELAQEVFRALGENSELTKQHERSLKDKDDKYDALNTAKEEVDKKIITIQNDLANARIVAEKKRAKIKKLKNANAKKDETILSLEGSLAYNRKRLDNPLGVLSGRTQEMVKDTFDRTVLFPLEKLGIYLR